MHTHTHINTKGDQGKHQHLCLADAGGRKEATFWARNRAIGPAGTADPFGLGGRCSHGIPVSAPQWEISTVAKYPERLVFMTESNEGGVRR